MTEYFIIKETKNSLTLVDASRKIKWIKKQVKNHKLAGNGVFVVKRIVV